MNTKFSLFILIVIPLALSAGSSTPTNLCINEIMQSNIDNLMNNNDFPDSWVELYNPTDADIDLYGYKIGQDGDTSLGSQWSISLNHDLVIPARGYLLIYCDKGSTGQHTDFRLDSGKGELYLFDSSGQTIDSLSYKKMPAANVAYGRVTDGGKKWQYEVTPTPGVANASIGSKNVLPDPVFSIAGGIITDSAITLTISMPADEYPIDTRLYVTTNGQEPTKASQSGTSFTFDISRSIVVRAKLISDSALTARSVTHSYIFHPRNVTLPLISIVTDSNYLYSDSLGILAGQPTDSMPNYMQTWRRPINIEYFDGDSTWFNQLSETAVMGNGSRFFAQKSMKIYANKRFGTKRFTGNFWEDKPGVTEVKSFAIRNGGSHCFLDRIAEPLVQKIFGTHTTDMDWMAYSPVIVYINGKFAGEYNMRERSDEDYVESNYNGLEDIERVEHSEYLKASEHTATPLFQEFYDTYSRPNVTYAEIGQQMDVENFMDILIAEMYGTNIDYPQNNVSLWRPTQAGGRWRWILKDMDFFAYIRPENYDMFKYMFLSGNPEDQEYQDATQPHHYDVYHQLYVKMMTFTDFRERFTDKMATYLGDFLKSRSTVALADILKAEVKDEVENTYPIYGESPVNFEYYYNDLVLPFLNQRPLFMYHHMAEYFGLGAVYPMTIAPEEYEVTVNDIPLTEGDFDGAYFENRNLRLKADADGMVWQATLTHADQSTQILTFDSNDIATRLGDYATDTLDTMQVRWELIDTIETDVVTISSDKLVISPTISIDGNWDEKEIDGMTIDLVDNFGKVLKRFAHENLPVNIADNIPSGIYYIRIITGTGKYYVEKLIVN